VQYKNLKKSQFLRNVSKLVLNYARSWTHPSLEMQPPRTHFVLPLPTEAGGVFMQSTPWHQVTWYGTNWGWFLWGAIMSHVLMYLSARFFPSLVNYGFYKALKIGFVIEEQVSSPVCSCDAVCFDNLHDLTVQTVMFCKIPLRQLRIDKRPGTCQLQRSTTSTRHYRRFYTVS
jgi:hypothetical protein